MPRQEAALLHDENASPLLRFVFLAPVAPHKRKAYEKQKIPRY